MGALLLCLILFASTLSSCGYFADSFLDEYGFFGDFSVGDVLENDETTKRRPTVITQDRPWETSKAPTTNRPYETTRTPETTKKPQTTRPVTTVPETTDNIPDEFQEHVYLLDMNKGRCPEMIGDVAVTVIFVNDSESSWDATAIANAKDALGKQEKTLEAAAASFGKKLDVTFSYTNASYSGVITSSSDGNVWHDTVVRSIGLSGINKAQGELEAASGADSNPIAFILNKTGRAYALAPTSKNNSERVTLFSFDLSSFMHELCHLYGAADYYYPGSVKELAEKYLKESIMNNGDSFDPLTAFVIGWDEEMDDEARDFLKATEHLTREYLNEENSKQQTTGYVTNFDLYNYNGIYTGYLEMGVPEGQGKLIYNDGGYYDGNFFYGSYHGKGTRVWKDGGAYAGSWDMGQLNGKGKYTWSSGAYYDGDWVYGVRTGQGTYATAEGYKYVGAWKNDKYHGYGEKTWADGASYKGYLSNGEEHGQGTYRYPSGATYQGAWVNGQRTGYGVYTWADGSRYEGDFVNGVRTGYGVYTWTDGTRYEGNFVNGARQGYGKMIWASGAYYDGYWENNKRHGTGKYVNQNGTVFDGNWVNDVFQG